MLSKERGQYFQEQYDKLQYQFANNELNKKCEQLENENKQLKKQKDDVVNLIKVLGKYDGKSCTRGFKLMTADFNNLLRMLGEENV